MHHHLLSTMASSKCIWKKEKEKEEVDTCTHILEGLRSLIVRETPGELSVDVHILVEEVVQLYVVRPGLTMEKVT